MTSKPNIILDGVAAMENTFVTSREMLYMQVVLPGFGLKKKTPKIQDDLEALTRVNSV